MNSKELATSMMNATAAQPGLSLDELTNHLVDEGVKARDAERATNFFQLACSRIFLEGLGVTPTEKYVRFDADGVILEGGAILDEPIYAASLEALRVCSSPQAFLRIAMSSSEVDAVNQALHAGANPTDLVATPSAMFDERPTPEGLAVAKRVIQEMSRPASRKPWWKLW